MDLDMTLVDTDVCESADVEVDRLERTDDEEWIEDDEVFSMRDT